MGSGGGALGNEVREMCKEQRSKKNAKQEEKLITLTLQQVLATRQ